MTPYSFIVSAATRSTTAFWSRSSFTCPTSGIMISGTTFCPSFFSWQAAAMIALVCISVISG